MKRILAVLLACTMLFSVAAMTGCNDGSGQLVVATNSEFPPFEYRDGNKFSGIDIEIAKLIADELNMELVIQDMPFDAVVNAVGKNKVDIAMAGLTVSETRKQAVDFTTSYFEASQMIIVKSENTTFDGCETTEDVEEKLNGLTNKKAGFQSGTTAEFYLAGDEDWEFPGYDNIGAEGYLSGALAVADVINGKIDFVVIDEMPARSIAAKQSGKVKVIEVKLTNEQYAYGVDKKQPALKDKINAILTRIIGDKTLEGIVDKYYDDARISERIAVDAGTVR